MELLALAIDAEPLRPQSYSQAIPIMNRPVSLVVRIVAYRYRRVTYAIQLVESQRRNYPASDAWRHPVARKSYSDSSHCSRASTASIMSASDSRFGTAPKRSTSCGFKEMFDRVADDCAT